MGFKKMRSIRRTYDEQGYICFLCRTYNRQPDHVKRKIDALCCDIGGIHKDALFDLVTSRKTAQEISHKRHLSLSVLYELRKRFYENFKF